MPSAKQCSWWRAFTDEASSVSDDTPRWRYRFSNYARAFVLLREAVEGMDDAPLSQLEKEGLIQWFEYTMELAWNVARDYLEHEGVVFDQVTPRAVLRRAFEANLIADGQVWMDALDTRNRMSHTCSFASFEEAIEEIRSRYLAAMEELYSLLLKRTDGA